MKDIFENIKIEEVLNELPLGIKSSVINLVDTGYTYDQIGLEMSQNPSFGLATKGGDKWDSSIYQKVIEQLRLIICTDDSRFNALRKKLIEEGKSSTTVIIAVISGWVGQELGVAVSICVPFVVLSVATVLASGLEVFCKWDNQEVDKEQQMS